MPRNTAVATPLPQVPVQRRTLMEQEFGDDFQIVWKSSQTATIQPKTQPSKLQATLFPMWKTRFSYDVIFDDKTNHIELKDNYAITFNRANGATPDQQDRIRQEEMLVIRKCQNIMKALTAN